MTSKHVLQLLVLLAGLLVPMMGSTTPAAVDASARPTLIAVHAPTLDAVNDNPGAGNIAVFPPQQASPAGSQFAGQWTELDNNSATANIVADFNHLYQRWSGGQIWEYTGTGAACQASPCPGWTQLDGNKFTAELSAAGGDLYQRWSSGQVWQYTGQPCQAQGTSCTGWALLDDQLNAAHIAAAEHDVYQLDSNGAVLKHNR